MRKTGTDVKYVEEKVWASRLAMEASIAQAKAARLTTALNDAVCRAKVAETRIQTIPIELNRSSKNDVETSSSSVEAEKAPVVMSKEPTSVRRDVIRRTAAFNMTQGGVIAWYDTAETSRRALVSAPDSGLASVPDDMLNHFKKTSLEVRSQN